jgi:hypothetical protein
MIFFGAKKKKNCASRFEAKKSSNAKNVSVCAEKVFEFARRSSWRHNCTGTGYSSTVLFWLFWEINGDKVATILGFKSADNIVGRDSGILPTIALIMSA